MTREADAAALSPWENEDWEGLTRTEILHIIKAELVPAQLAR